MRAFLGVKAVPQFVQNGWAFAENGVYLDQLLVGGDQLADVLPADFKFFQAVQILVKRKEALVGR
ncbi:MAG: hypothetical protein ACD_10C00402G0002 [uncultured bacterium]|nr:MAG: hypothetical protein ACD_10C00402G0002 [uncultured bacterium]